MQSKAERQKLNLEELGCYEKPSVWKDDPDLIAERECEKSAFESRILRMTSEIGVRR